MKCHIITAPASILTKLRSMGLKTATQLSLDAVKTFRNDALAAGYSFGNEAAFPSRRMSSPELAKANCIGDFDNSRRARIRNRFLCVQPTPH